MRCLVLIAFLGGCRGLLGIDEPGTTPPVDATPHSDSSAPGSDGTTDDGPHAGCPIDFVSVSSSTHVYKLTSSPGPWLQARDTCHAASPAAYLAVPDDPSELVAISTLAMTPYWVGVDDRTNRNAFVTDKGAPATFLPWGPGEPNNLGDCVEVRSNTYDDTDCAVSLFAICECEP